MENYNDDVFEFGVQPNEELEQTNDFNYASISGLGESDYQNEDLFNTEVDDSESLENNNYRIGSLDNVGAAVSDNLSMNQFDAPEFSSIEQPISTEEIFGLSKEEDIDDEQEENIEVENTIEDAFSIPIQNPEETFEQIDDDTAQNLMGDTFSIPIEQANEELEQDSIQDTNLDEEVYEFNPEPINLEFVQDESNLNEESFEPSEELVNEVPEETDEEDEGIVISETPIEELNALTHYEEEKIEETAINDLFDRVSVNVKEASDIFRKNTDLKKKIDNRFEELKKLQSEIENSRKKQIDEIDKYKAEVLAKLTEKKEEIEKRLNLLKESQATLEKEKQEFEQYKKEEKENIDKVQKEVQAAYDDRREELNHIEDVLRKQKDSLDEERSQLSLDRIEYEADKNELANNLLKFDELVNSFTNGISEVKE